MLSNAYVCVSANVKLSSNYSGPIGIEYLAVAIKLNNNPLSFYLIIFLLFFFFWDWVEELVAWQVKVTGHINK